MQKEVLINHKDGELCISCGGWFSNIVRERLRIPRTHSETGTNLMERISAENLKAIGKSFNLKKQKMTRKYTRIFWSIKGDFINRQHIEPRVQFFVPREESFPIPLKYIDVIRSTHTDLDVAQEKRVDDNWNVDGDRNLSVSWTGFTR